MHIYTKNIPAKFHPDLIWNGGPLGLKKLTEQEEEEQQQQEEQAN